MIHLVFFYGDKQLALDVQYLYYLYDFKITFSVWRRETMQPPLEYLQGNMTVEATLKIQR